MSTKSNRIAIYPGTFDPITNGHIDVIRRAALITDHLIIAIADNTPKTPVFNLEERVGMVQADIAAEGLDNVEVRPFQGLLVDFAAKNNAVIIIRGLRAVSDFEYEFQLASMNSRLEPALQTIFIPASENTHFIASSLVKEVARLGGDIAHFVSPTTAEKLRRKFT